MSLLEYIRRQERDHERKIFVLLGQPLHVEMTVDHETIGYWLFKEKIVSYRIIHDRVVLSTERVWPVELIRKLAEKL